MLGTLPPTNWFQISKEIPLLFVIMFHRVWDGGEGGSKEKGRGVPDICNSKVRWRRQQFWWPGGDITSSPSASKRLKSSEQWEDKKDMDDFMELIEGGLIGGDVSAIEIKPGCNRGPAGTALDFEMTYMALTVWSLQLEITLTALTEWSLWGTAGGFGCSATTTLCYRCLEPPTFFPYSVLSTSPLSMGHDNQQQRDLLRDLGPIHRQWCYKHCLLKAESITSLLLISFSFWTYLYCYQHDYATYHFHVIMLMLLHQHNWLISHPL